MNLIDTADIKKTWLAISHVQAFAFIEFIQIRRKANNITYGGNVFLANTLFILIFYDIEGLLW
ncbi:hypothetical protein GCM10008924_18390 [Gracilibacillus halotolerans]